MTSGSLLKCMFTKNFMSKRVNEDQEVDQEYEAIVMEKCLDSDFMLSKNETSRTSNSKICIHDSYLMDKTEEKKEFKSCCKISKVGRKIASEERSSGPTGSLENITPEKTRRHQTGTDLNVLSKEVTDTARQSVQKKTKKIKSNVPDRLGKYVSYRDRSEIKFLLNVCNVETESSSSECSPDRLTQPSRERSDVSGDHTETKIAVLGNECLIYKEADRLRNSVESDLEAKNIFESFLNNCLDSTSIVKDASSQENVNSEEIAKNIKSVEKTPEKKKLKMYPTGAPVKDQDHSNYYSSHKNIRHVCAYCHKIFKSNGKLNSHVYSHTGERPFDCNHCGKAFSSKFKLVRHLLIHSEVRKFVCQICDRTFLRNDHLKNHYKIHDPQKKMYKCPKENCDKEYSSIVSHKKHMAYHNVEDGDLKCLICNVKYETKEEILFHLKSHSGSRIFKSQCDKKFKCQFCDRLFLTRKDVTRHLVVHTGERDFLCQFCPQRFGRKDHLVRHIKKSHGNEDLVKNEEIKLTKDELKKADEIKNKNKLVKTDHSRNPEFCSQIKENSTRTEENKTHIVITVQKKALQNRDKRKLQKKAFQKNELLVPKKKQMPLVKSKSSTTQILLQNIPNILIIPNNSIILLRNQSSSKNFGESQSDEPEPSAPPEPRINEDLISFTQPPSVNDLVNFNYDSNIFPASSQFIGGLHENDNFCHFQTDLPTFGCQFDEPDFEMLNQNELLPRNEIDLTTDALPNGNLMAETPREANATTGKLDREKSGCDDIARELSECENEAFVLNESILNEFRDDSSAILPTDNDVGILGNILNQSNDNCSFELLRHLLTSENPVLSPLPGFSQIFHNSNANSS